MVPKRRAVLVICDGFRGDMISSGSTPNLARMAITGRRLARHRSVFPSVTRVAAATIATGCLPARHGLSGNVIAIPGDDGGLKPCNSSRPEFLHRFPALTGRPGGLREPTVMARWSAAGGQGVVCSNASAGAAWLLDPTHSATLYHPLGCTGPGGESITPPADLGCGKWADGDRRMTRLFCRDVLTRPEIGLGILWLSEPDIVNHSVTLGAPESIACLQRVDALIGEVTAAVTARRDLGEDILLLVGSDHGHETVEAVVDIVTPFVTAGLKRSADSSELLVLPQGSAGLVFAAHPDPSLAQAVGSLLRKQEWVGTVVAGAEALAAAGLALCDGLIAAFSLATRPIPNTFGVPGLVLTASGPGAKPDRVGCGTHGGLGRYETQAFLIVQGGETAGEGPIDVPTSILDIAPTIALHLGLRNDVGGEVGQGGFDGTAIQTLIATPDTSRAVPGLRPR